MKTGLLHLHGLLPWFLIVLPLVAIITSLIGEKNEQVSAKPSKWVLFTLIFTHVQLLVGLVLWVMAWANNVSGMKEIMKDPVARKQMIEHPVTMLLAATLITIGYSKAKRATNGRARAKKVAIFYGIAIVLILAMNHWDKMAFLK